MSLGDYRTPPEKQTAVCVQQNKRHPTSQIKTEVKSVCVESPSDNGATVQTHI